MFYVLLSDDGISECITNMVGDFIRGAWATPSLSIPESKEHAVYTEFLESVSCA